MDSFSVSLVLLWLRFMRVSSQQEVEQSPESVSVPEGATASLNCTYRNSAFQYFFWYRQYPGKGPVPLVSTYSNGEKREGRFTVQLNKGSRQVSLDISGSQHRDSATYLCAADTTHTSAVRLTFGDGTRVAVKPSKLCSSLPSPLGTINQIISLRNTLILGLCLRSLLMLFPQAKKRVLFPALK